MVVIAAVESKASVGRITVAALGRRMRRARSSSRDGLGEQQLRRIDARQFVADGFGRERQHDELARRHIGEGEGEIGVAMAQHRERGEIVAEPRAGSRSSSVSVPRVTRRTTSRFTDRLAAALLGFGDILDLLADRDAMAERDQLLEIILRGVDGHAAERDVIALILAAPGEDDAERAPTRSRRPRRTSRRNRPCGRTADSPD